MNPRMHARLLGVWCSLGLVLSCGVTVQEGASADKPAASRWALLVGVDDYTELGKLRFAGSDQRALAKQLTDSGFPQDQVFLLHGKATEPKYMPFRENIEKQLDLVLGLANPNDLVIVGFSGHGVQLEGKSYLCPMDARLDKLAATTIPLDGIYDRLGKCRATLKLLLVDACRNDLLPVGRRSVVLSRSLGEFGGVKEKPPEGILLLASCGPGQVSMEDEAFGHGVFMHYLLEGLGGKAANAAGSVSLAGLYDYASLETKKYVARKFNEYQTPALRGEISGPFEIVTSGPAKSITNSIGMKLVLIPAGEFMMGSQESVEDLAKAFAAWDAKPEYFKGESPYHRVRITKPFYLGTYEVTVGQFRQFVNDAGYKTDAEKDGKGGWGYKDGEIDGQKPEYGWRNTGFEQTDDHPVVNVSWNDAVAFCEWLSRKEAKTYRLPAEAEWEYACRAGTTTRYWSGDDPETLMYVGNVADATWFAKFPHMTNWAILNSDGYVFTAPVGRFRANAFGVYDMHGNALEWCADWYGEGYYAASPPDDPKGPDPGKSRVLRGGSWFVWLGYSRSAYRDRSARVNRNLYTGFRAARTP